MLSVFSLRRSTFLCENKPPGKKALMSHMGITYCYLLRFAELMYK